MNFFLYIAQACAMVSLVGVEPGETNQVYRLKCHRESVGLYHFRRFFCEVGMPKRGDVHPETGLIYWDKAKSKERWIDNEKFASWKIKNAASRSYPRRKASALEYRLKNKDKLYAKRREYYKANKDSEIEYNRSYVKENKDRLNYLRRLARQTSPMTEERLLRRKEWTRLYTKQRRHSDVQFRLAKVLRSRLNMAFRNGRGKKLGSTIALLGTTIFDFRRHIESKWLPGMSWKNYGVSGWHLDHIIPCAAFDLSTVEGQKKCFHYSNIQPLWAFDNSSKSSTYNGVHYRSRSLNTTALLCGKKDMIR